MENTEKINLGSRINKLPDAILHHVLSFLDMKQVVETTLISTRWRYLWIHVPTLNFDFSLRNYQSPGTDCNKFVEYVFLLHDGFSAKKFSFACSSVNMEILNMWLTMLSRKHVPQVSLKISSPHDTKELVPLFFTSSVEVVDIKSTFRDSHGISKHNVQLPNSICCAPHLKTLKLNSIKLPKGDSKKEVTLKCHVLENLVLEDCYYAHLTSFNISIPQLKVLTVKNIEGKMATTVGSCKIGISTCNLTTLWLKCCSFDNYYIEKCDSLASAKIEFACGTLVSGEGKVSLECLRNVSSLDLSNWTLEICLGFQDMLDQIPDILCNLRSLKLVKWHQAACTSALASLLTRSPNLEYLILEWIQEKSNTSTVGDLGVLPSFGDHLKSVDIWNFTGCQVEMKLVESVLKNSISLEELTITVHSSRSSKAGLKDYMRKIHSLPRVSSQVLVCVLPQWRKLHFF